MRKGILSLLIVWVMAVVIGIWIVGGQIAAYLWNISVFICAPIALIAFLIQILLFIKALCRKKKIIWNITFITISIILALPITVFMGISPLTYPTNEKLEDSISVLMPVKDAVVLGGENYKTHAMWPSECYAYDIVCEPYDVGSTELSDYGIFGADIMAPISGTVIGMDNDEPDITPNCEEFTSSLGNYVFIKVDNSDSYLILTHLEKNSITVSVNSHIEEGTIIGRVGNSGTTSEPHLHIQHQRNNPLEMTIPICAEGLPITFR